MADITSSLVAWYKLNETSGTTATDSSGNGNTGTYTNSPTLSVTGAFSGSRAVAFASASSQYVALGIKSSSSPDQTIAFWFNASDLTGTRNAVTWGKNEVRLTTTAVRYYPDNDTVGGTNFSTTFSTGVWYHVAVVQSSTTATVYVNGASIGSSAVSALDSVGAASFIASYLASNYFSGTIDDVRIYARALSASDVAALYTYTGGSDYSTGLVAHYKLDEQSGTTAADSTGNGYTGTYVNSPTLSASGAFGSSRAVAFASASSQQVTISSAALISAMSSSYTVALWSKQASQTNKAAFSIVTPTIVIYPIDQNASNKARIYNAGGALIGTSTPTPNAWVHICLVVSSATAAKLYVNGVLEASVSTGTWTASGTALAIGNYSGQFADATIDDVRVYSRALSPDDVAALYLYRGDSTVRGLYGDIFSTQLYELYL